MSEVRNTSCCGLQEIAGITEHNDPKETISLVAQNRYEEEDANGAFYFFTDTHEAKNAKKLARYIHMNGLGRVTRSRSKRNPNTGNMLIVFMWALNGPALKKWHKAHKQEEDHGNE